MIKLSLILRCRNRLEYTLQVLNALARQVNAPPFEVVLVDNASTDHTTDVVQWLLANNGTRQWFPPIKLVKLETNVGDFGGMQVGSRFVADSAVLVGQIDNDILLPPAALDTCCSLVAQGKADVAMLRRVGFSRSICPIRNEVRTFQWRGNKWQIVPVEHAVAFWVTRKQPFMEHVLKVEHCRQLTKSIGKVAKVTDLTCTQIEGWQVDGSDTYTQKQKYGKSEHTPACEEAYKVIEAIKAGYDPTS